VLAQLIEQADRPLCVEWFETDATPGPGAAYRTQEGCHLLNVRTARMGAFAGQPEGFLHWLHTPQGQEQIDQVSPTWTAHADSYAPRALYGRYLRAVVIATVQKAAAKGIIVRIHQATVTDAQVIDSQARQLRLTSEGVGRREHRVVDALVLATGNQPPRRIALPVDFPEVSRHYVTNCWQPPQESLYPQQVAALAPESQIMILGTGLTMVDVVLSLLAHGYRGQITALSRHGWLPAAHAHTTPYPAWAWVKHPEETPRTALGLFRQLRQEINHAATLGYDWRSVIDSLRPVTQQIWQQLSRHEQRKFQRHLLTLWNVHRHRLAPEVAAQVQALRARGALRLVAGELCQVAPTPTGLAVTYRAHGSQQATTLPAALLINCTGPNYDLTSTASTLLTNLRNRGLITPHPLGLGLLVDESGRAVSPVAAPIFPLGTLLVGDRLECTAVPELREQACDVAAQLLQSWLATEQTGIPVDWFTGNVPRFPINPINREELHHGKDRLRD
jgi:uncharacterized NAD(P)/FAD-binding protein YdhS